MSQELAAYGQSVAVLRRELAERRRVGVAFEDAWPEAVSAAGFPASPEAQARLPLEATRKAWAAAYEGRAPTSRHRAVAALRG